ncbi:MAG: hypothetical protein U0401_09630 [Anaerolineae bacterium]
MNIINPTGSLRTSIMVLVAATVAIAYLSEVLVGAVEPVVEELGITEFFLGIILIPLVGNAAEHVVAVQMAMKTRWSYPWRFRSVPVCRWPCL